MKVKRLQEGGQVAPPAEQTPAEGGGNSANEQLAQMAMQIVQQLGPEASAALAQMIMQILQQGAQQAPAFARKGGKLVAVK